MGKNIVCFTGQVRTVLLFFAVCLTVSLIISNCSKKPDPVKIGAILSMTGPASHLGGIRETMQMAADEINAAGGINGRPLEIIFTDSQTNPQTAKKRFQELMNQNPLCIISTLSSVCLALTPLAEENQIPLIGLVTTASELTLGKNWIFRFYPTAEHEVPPIMTLLRKTGAKRLGIVYQDDPYGKSVNRLLKKNFEQEGGAVTGKSFSIASDTIFDKTEKIFDVDSIYVVGYPKNMAQIIKSIRNSGYDGTLLGSSGATHKQVIALAEAEGTYMASPIIYNHNFIYAKELIDKYETKFEKQLTHYTATGYDIVRLISSLLDGREISRSSVKAVIEEGFHFPSSLGDIIVEAGEHHEINFPLYPAQIVNKNIIFLGN